MITILSRFKAKDVAASETLQKLLLTLKEQAPLEQGYMQYESFVTAEDAAVFYLKDSWASQPDVDRHAQQIQNNGYLDQATMLLAEPMTAVTLIEL